MSGEVRCNGLSYAVVIVVETVGVSEKKGEPSMAACCTRPLGRRRNNWTQVWNRERNKEEGGIQEAREGGRLPKGDGC